MDNSNTNHTGLKHLKVTSIMGRTKHSEYEAYQNALSQRNRILSEYNNDVQVLHARRKEYRDSQQPTLKYHHNNYVSYQRYKRIINKFEQNGVHLNRDSVNNNNTNDTCSNCKRKQNQSLIEKFGAHYKLKFKVAWSNKVISRHKFRGIQRTKAPIQTYYLCNECFNFLCVPGKLSMSMKNLWPSFMWYSIIGAEDVQNVYGRKIWQLVPYTWRHWWIESIRDSYGTVFDNISVEHPRAIIVDRTSELTHWNSCINSGKLSKLSEACNRHMVPCILCPFGCSEFIFSTKNVEFDLMLQRYLQHVIITTINPKKKMDFIFNAREDYIRFDERYETWLLNDEWEVLPSVCFIEDKPTCLTCRDHENGCRKFYCHHCRQPSHNLSAARSDQLAHAVIRPRTIRPMKSSTYSNTFQMHEQRGCFNGLDTCSVTNYGNFAFTSYLLEENEARSIWNRPDINALLTQLAEDGVISHYIANERRKTARDLCQSIDFTKFTSGGSYVPLNTAILIQKQLYEKDVPIVWDDRGNELPSNTLFSKRPFSAYLYPVHVHHAYGATVPTLPCVKSKTTITSTIWTIIALFSRVEPLWQATRNATTFYQSKWHGWVYLFIQHNCFKHLPKNLTKHCPFQIKFISAINRFIEKVGNHLSSEKTLNDIFNENNEIMCLQTVEDSANIQRLTDEITVVMIENHRHGSNIPMELVMDEKHFELRAVVGVEPNNVKYNAYIFSRHGGLHKGWWYQGRNDEIPTKSHEEVPRTKANYKNMLCYIRTREVDCSSANIQFLKYIGGQSHVICKEHKMPLIHSSTRSSLCKCGKKEFVRCPNISCQCCVCKECFATMNDSESHLIDCNDNSNNESSNNDNDDDNDDDDGDSDNESDVSIVSWINPPDLFDEIDSDSDDDNSSTSSSSSTNSLISIARSCFDDYVTTAELPNVDFRTGGESDDDDDEDDFYPSIPTTNAGEYCYDIENEDKRHLNQVFIEGHVILNQCGTILSRKRHQIKGANVQKAFLQRIASTSIGVSSSLMYPEAMLFPSIFYKSVESDGAIVGALPAALLTQNISKLGFASLPQHCRTRLTSPLCATSSNPRYIAFQYDTLTNLAVNHSDTRIAIQKGLTASGDESGGLGLRANSSDSALLEAMDSKFIVRGLSASQKYFTMDYFATFTCNMKKHFGTKPIKDWIDSDGWTTSFPNQKSMTDTERDEMKGALNQAAGQLLLRAWNETCRFFLRYLQNSTSSPFKKVLTMFARFEYQKDVGNLPHIHSLLKIHWETLSSEEKEFVKELIRASVLEIVRPDEAEHLRRDGIISSMHDIDDIIKDAQTMLTHHCSPRCLMAVGDGVYKCRKVNYLRETLDNTRHVFKPLPNDYSMECLERLVKIGLVEPLQFNEAGYMKPFKSSDDFFHPKRHIPPVNWTHDLNISPVEGYTFAACRSMQNLQWLTHCGGCHKYVVKYIGKIDEQNYVVVSTNGNKNGSLVTRGTFLHNTKIATSKINEDKMKTKKGDNKRVQGRCISLMEMVHSLLKYSEVYTDLVFVEIPTTPLEVRPGIYLKQTRHQTQDAAEAGIRSQNVREELNLVAWRKFTQRQVLLLGDMKYRTKLDNITAFSIRPPELLSVFKEVGNYFRWFHIDTKTKMNREEHLQSLSNDLRKSCWIDGLERKVLVREKAIPEVQEYLRMLENEETLNDGQRAIITLFNKIERVLEERDLGTTIRNTEQEQGFHEHVLKNLVHSTDVEKHLPIPVYTFTMPTLVNQFLLHIMLSLGKFDTELDLFLHRSLRECFQYCKLIGTSEDLEDLAVYSNELCKKYIQEQVKYFPNAKMAIDSFIVSSGHIFDDAIIENNIAIRDFPPVQMSSLFKRNDEKCKKFIRDTKESIIVASLSELGCHSEHCPDAEELLACTKEDPIEWNPIESFRRSENQSEASFVQQKNVLESIVSTLDTYANIANVIFVKSTIIRGSAGSGKSFCMVYSIVYSLSKGLLAMTTAMMARRSNCLGGKHIHILFCLPTEKNMSPQRAAEIAIAQLGRYPERINLLLILDILYVDEIGQLSAETLSILDIIMRRLRGVNIFMGGLIIICTMDHLQLQPVSGRPFLLSSHIIPCFKMVRLDHSVRASSDRNFCRIQEITRMKYNHLSEEVIEEFKSLCEDTFSFVESWSNPKITPSTYRLYGRRSPAVDATTDFVNSVEESIESSLLRKKECEDTQRNRFSHSEWGRANPQTSAKLDKKVKEPSTLLFFRGAIYEFTFNSPNDFSQSQMAVLFDLPTQDALNRNQKIKVLAAPPGHNDIVFDPERSKESFVRDGFKEVKVGLAPDNVQCLGYVIQAKRKQYGLKHRVTSTIHASMGDTLTRVAIQIQRDNSRFKLWDKAQVIVALSRTKLGKNTIFVGDKNETIESLIELIRQRGQWTDYMEEVMDIISGVEAENRNQSMNMNSFPFRICDIELPQCNTGFVYFLNSMRSRTFCYIGQTKCLRTRIISHNSGYGSTSTSFSHLRPFAVMAYIAGFDGRRELREHVEAKWKEKRDEMIMNGNDDLRTWARCGGIVINNLDEETFNIRRSDLRLVLLFKDE